MSYADRLRWAIVLLPLLGFDPADVDRWIMDNSTGGDLGGR